VWGTTQRAVWLAALAGALFPLGLAPFDLWPLALVAVATLFVCLESAAPRRALLIGWAFGVGKYGVGASWIYVSIHDYGPAPWWLAGSLVTLFVAAMALFPAVAGFAYARWLRGASAVGRALGFTVAWSALEWLLTWFLTGFPWLFLGYAQLQNPLRHWAPVGGVLWVGWLAVLSVTLAVLACARDLPRRRRALLGLAALLPWLLALPLGAVRWVEPGRAGSVALVQGDIPQDAKWHEETVAPILSRYSRLSAPYWQRDLVIWPEAAVTLFVRQAQPFLTAMDALASRGGAALILGIPSYQRLPDGGVAFRNSAIVVGAGQGSYSKRRLVPFGEYVPFEGVLRGLIEFFDLPMSHAEPGAMQQPLLEAGAWRVAMAICYEVAYPELVRRDARDADVIVTISNDSWFGRSIGPHQHLQMAAMRALENGRWVLRATNSGITAIIAPDGVVAARLPQFEAVVLDGTFSGMTGTTPYGRWGNALLFASLAAAGAAALLLRRRT
jgi:apolipoprotein N-acyltransferase